MKTFAAFILILLMTACRQDMDSVQQIDQVVQLYFKNKNGADMLNSGLEGSFRQVDMKDLGGIYDQVPLPSPSLRKDQNAVTYLEYIAGAKRNLTDSAAALKHYRSDILLQFRKTAADSVDADTLSIFYEWTPQIFKVKKMNYNGKTVFTKTDGQPNTAVILKN